MEKYCNKAGTTTTLVILGWLTFLSSFLISDCFLLSLILQSVARVLP